MITLKEWMEVVNYRITEGSNYMWSCYGTDAYSLDSWNGEQEGHSLTVTFDQRTQEVYEVQIHDYRHNRAYRMINPDYVEAHNTEAESRATWMKEAWEGVDYIDLDVDDDWFQKALAVVAGEDYDTRVSVAVDFSDQDLLTYMKLAHERDITFNELITEALTEAIKNYEVDPEGAKQQAQDWLLREDWAQKD
jgi:hypothetical protein